MFEQERLTELKSLFTLFKNHESSLKELIHFMKPWIEKEGLKIIKNSEYQKDPYKLTQELLDFKAKCDNMVKEAFDNDINFERARDIAFQNFL